MLKPSVGLSLPDLFYIKIINSIIVKAESQPLKLFEQIVSEQEFQI